MGNAVSALGIFAGAAVFALPPGKFDELADNKDQPAIIVVVNQTALTTIQMQPRRLLLRDITEGSVSVVCLPVRRIFPGGRAKTAAPAKIAKRGYCIPHLYKPTSSWLFHNNGDGTFTDVSKASGIAGSLGKAWAQSRQTSTTMEIWTSSSLMTPWQIFFF